MASDNCDDIEILEVVTVAKKCKAEPTEKKKTLHQSTLTKFYSINKDDSSSSDTIIFENSISNEKVEEPKCSTSAAVDKNHVSSVLHKSENGKSSNTLGSKAEPGLSDGESSNTTGSKAEQELLDGESNSIKTLEKFILKWKELLGNQFESKIEAKLWKNYNQSSFQYRSGQKFVSAVLKGTAAMKESTVYLVITEIVDKLKQNKSCPKITSVTSCKNRNDSDVPIDEDADHRASKNEYKLRKLEKEMNRISARIQELDEEEVDFSDETDSAYLKQDWLQKQMIKLDNHYCKLLKCSTNTGRATQKKFKFNGTRYPEINNRISAWVNKNKCFPDYVDIYDLLKKVTKEKNLPIKAEAIRLQAEEILTSVGKVLKHRRMKDYHCTINSFSKDEVPLDPAGFDADLESRLMNNEAEAKEKMDKVFQDYVDKEVEGLFPEDGSTSSEDDEDSPSQQKSDMVLSDCNDECTTNWETKNSLVGESRYTPNLSLDSFPDLTNRTSTPYHQLTPNDQCDDYEEDEVAVGEQPDNVVTIEDDCNGLATDANQCKTDKQSNCAQELIGDILSDEDSCVISNNNQKDFITIETVDIDTSTSELDEYESKKRSRSNSHEYPYTKRRCQSPEIVELD